MSHLLRRKPWLAVLECTMDKSGLTFVILLCALGAILLSVVLFNTREPAVPPDAGSLIPPDVRDQLQ